MARAYTAWVIQNGKGKEAKYLGAHRDGYGNDAWGWYPDIRKALQLVRRSDARNLLIAEQLEDEGRAVEKTFG